MPDPNASLPSADGPRLFERLPHKLTGPLTELGVEPAVPLQIQLSRSDIEALEDALSKFKALGISGHEISRDNFVLPFDLSKQLLDAAKTIHYSCGVCIIKGLNPSLYSDADNLLLFLAFANFVGDKQGVQDKKGNVITHITDAKSWLVPYKQRHGAHTNQSLTWHCDMGADILALQIRQVAAKGGHTFVASSWKVYNDLMSERPDIVQVLAQPNWPVHMSNRKSRYSLAPLLAFEDNKLLFSFDPSRLGARPEMRLSRSQRTKQVPDLTDIQFEALCVVSSIAERNRVQLKTDSGDLMFINNWAVMHSRSAYEDAESSTGGEIVARRHLLRLWLRNSELGWKIPESMRAPWETAFGYTDEGYVSGDYHQVVAQLRYDVVPEPDYKPARYTTGSAAFTISESDDESDSVVE